MHEIIWSFMTIKVLYIVTCTSFTQPVRRDEFITLSTGTSLFCSSRNICLYNIVHKSISTKSSVQTVVFLLFLTVWFLHVLKGLKTSVAIITLTTKNFIHPCISTLWTYCQFISFTNFNAQFLYSLTILCYITILDMFRALTCPSSGGQIVLSQHLVSSLSVNGCTVCRMRADSVCSHPAYCTVLYREWRYQMLW